MADLQFDNFVIAALTCSVPSHVQKIDIEGDTTGYAKTFVKQTGVTQRHISITEQTCLDLGYAASLNALEKTGWPKESIDAVIFMSQTPDYNPGTGNGCLLQYRLGLPATTLAFDITLGCSSFPYGLSVCGAFLQQKGISRVLMVSGDTLWCSYASARELLAANTFLEGEACTAILFEKKENSTPITISLHSDGSGYKYLFHPYGGTRNGWRHSSPVILPNGETYSSGKVYMDGMEITSFATTTVVESIKNYLQRSGKHIQSYDGLVLHQANKQIVKTIAKRLGVPMEKVPTSMELYGNTSGTSTTLTMAHAYAGSEKESLSLLACSFGIGLSWGIADFSIAPSAIDCIRTCEGNQFEEGFVRPVIAAQ